MAGKTLSSSEVLSVWKGPEWLGGHRAARRAQNSQEGAEYTVRHQEPRERPRDQKGLKQPDERRPPIDQLGERRPVGRERHREGMVRCRLQGAVLGRHGRCCVKSGVPGCHFILSLASVVIRECKRRSRYPIGRFRMPCYESNVPLSSDAGAPSLSKDDHMACMTSLNTPLRLGRWGWGQNSVRIKRVLCVAHVNSRSHTFLLR